VDPRAPPSRVAAGPGVTEPRGVVGCMSQAPASGGAPSILPRVSCPGDVHRSGDRVQDGPPPPRDRTPACICARTCHHRVTTRVERVKRSGPIALARPPRRVNAPRIPASRGGLVRPLMVTEFRLDCSPGRWRCADGRPRARIHCVRPTRTWRARCSPEGRRPGSSSTIGIATTWPHRRPVAGCSAPSSCRGSRRCSRA
jgi:hypothetical protein